MMRYQGLSPDNLPLSNGKRSHWRSCKEDDGIIGKDENDATKTIPNFVEAHKGVPKFRSSPSKTSQDQNFSTFSTTNPNSLPKTNHDLNNFTTTPLHNGGGGSGDMLLQWGHRKRSRISRSVENRAAGAASGMADDSSSSSSTQLQAMMKVPRRSITLPTPSTASVGLIETKNTSNTNIMPPPSSILPNAISVTTSAAAAAAAVTNSSTSNGKVGNHKSSSKDKSSFVNRRNLEDRSGGGSGSHPPRNGSSGKGVIAAASSSRSKVVKRSPQKVVEKNDHVKIVSNTTTAAAAAACSFGSALLRSDEKVNGLVHQEQVGGFGMNNHQNNIGSALLQEAGCSNTTSTTNNNHDDIIGSKIVAGAATGNGGEVNEWPRVHVPLTRKEKEEDFLLMKGTKLPHRPKKRPKAVDRMLQYCFPGTWLADVTKARYEVKEKKGTTKKPKRRGLKGMESMESDSE